MCHGNRFTVIILAVILLTDAADGQKTKPLPDDPAAKARTIMNRIDDLWRGTSSRARMSMSIRTKHWARTMRLDSWALERDYSLVRITAPRKEAGTATLKVKKDIYNYLPKTDRTIKITSGMMMNAWMGSHFTNDDLVKESRLATDYFLKIIFEGKRDGAAIWEIQLDPKPDAAVVWGKILFTVRQTDLMPVKAEYYDEDNVLVRTMSFSDYTRMGGRLLPAKMTLTPADKPGEFTELIYEDINFDIALDKGFFSLKNLKRKHG